MSRKKVITDMVISVLTAKRFPTKKKASSNSGRLRQKVSTPIGMLNRAFSMVERPLTPPGAIWLGAVKQKTPAVYKNEPATTCSASSASSFR